jgi:ATP-dependent RNA helicase RhlE
MTEIQNFDSLGLIEPLREALRTQGYEKPTPIQAHAIPIVLSGKDLLGCARTGTGKTAAFALPSLQLMENDKKALKPRSARMLVLTPTRELAAQVEESFRTYGANTGLKFALAFGGVGKSPQAKALSRGVDVLVATPGRLLDLHGDGAVKLDSVEFFVLDEADRMLDMGFIHDMRKVFALLPKKRQTLLFSATMPKAIQEIASTILNEPEFVSVDPVSAPATGVEQHLYYAAKDQKRALLVKLLTDGSVDRALVFTRTKHLANRIAAQLNSSSISAEAIHANKSQTHRTKVLAAFKAKQIRVLVATDIAARGIDIDELPHVINFEIPNEPETYVHRIGRTARAGSTGTAISFCENEEKPFIRAIEKLVGKSIPVSFLPELPELPALPILPRGPRQQPKKQKTAEPSKESAKPKPIAASPLKPPADRRAQERTRADYDKPLDRNSGRPAGAGSRQRPGAPSAADQRRQISPFAPRGDRRQPDARGRRNDYQDKRRGSGGIDQTAGRSREPLSDEEAARRAASDPRQPGIIPFQGKNKPHGGDPYPDPLDRKR